MKATFTLEGVEPTRDWVSRLGKLELFRGRAGKAAEKAWDTTEAVNAAMAEAVEPVEVHNEVTQGRRRYFVKVGHVVLKESANAGTVHDFADVFNVEAGLAEAPVEVAQQVDLEDESLRDTEGRMPGEEGYEAPVE